MPPLEAKIDKLAKVKAPDATDKQVLSDGKKIRAGIQKVVKADKALGDAAARFGARQAAAGKKPFTVPEAKAIQSQFVLLWLDLEVAIRELALTTDDAYRAYATEADAYAAQGSVMTTFQAKPKPAAPKPPAPKP